MGVGFGAAKQSLAGLGGQLKSALGTAATLGGAVSLGAFARDALQAQDAAGLIASKLRVMGDAGATAQGVLDMTRDRADALRITAGDVRAAYQEMLEATGSRDFAAGGIEAAAQFQKVWRIGAGESGKLVSMLNEKLGVTASEIQNELGPALLGVTNKGGIGIQDLIAGGNGLLAMLPAIGESGTGGFRKLIALLNMTDDAGGDTGERMSQLQQVLIRFKDPDQLKLVSKELGRMKFDEKATALENFQRVLAKEGGEKALGKMLGGGRTAVIFKNLMQPFLDAKEEAVLRGATNKEALALGVEALKSAMDDASKSNLTSADMAREAAARDEEASQKFRVAIGKMSDAFTKPKFLGAMDKLSESLPRLADAFVSVADFVLDHPVIAGAAAVGGQGVAAAALPMAGSLLRSWLLPGADVLLGGARDAADTARKGAVESGATWRDSARVAGLNFSTAVGVAAAAFAGWKLGEQLFEQVVDPEMNADIGAGGASRTLMVKQEAERALRSGTVEEQKTALAKITEERKTIQRGSAWTDVVGNAASVFTDAPSSPELRARKEEQLLDVQAELAARIKSREALERLTKASEEAAKAVERAPSPTRGVRRPANPLPGDARVGS